MRPPSLKAWLAAGTIVLLVNTGYIAAFATPSVFYMMNVLAHLVLGVVLAAGFAVLLVRDRALPRGVGRVLAIAAGCAAYLVAFKCTRTPGRLAHVATAILGVVALVPR